MATGTKRHSSRTDQAIAGRLRALRKARGLSQGALAGDDFTKGFISQVEHGYSRLSVRAAQILAGRLEVDISDLLGEIDSSERATEARLLEAEQELAAGSPEVALRSLRALRATGRLRGRALRAQGRALLALDRTQEALTVLRGARIELRANGGAELAVRVLYDEALAHARLDQSEEAMLSALECERALRAGEIVDRTLELQVRTLLASAYVRRGDFAAADHEIALASELAQEVTSREARAALHASIAKTEQDRGHFDKAVEHWQRSMVELEALGREQAVAETWNNLALAQLGRGQLIQARQSLAHADELATKLQHTRFQPWIRVTRSKLALQERRFAEAEQLANEVVGRRGAPGRARSEALLVIARALRAQRAPIGRVRKAFEAAFGAIADAPPGARARVLREYGDALDAAGDAAGAINQLRAALDLLRPVPPV